MSLTTLNNNIIRKRKELSRIKAERVKLVNAINNASQRIIKLSQQVRTTKSQSALTSKLNALNREEKNKSAFENKVNNCDKKITTKEKELNIEEQKLYKEQEKNSKKTEILRSKEIKNINDNVAVQKSEYVKLHNTVAELKEAKEKINILFLASNPDIQNKLNLDKEAREIHESIQKSLQRDSINFQTRWAIRTSDLLDAINEVNPTIIHFSGHGTESGELLFQDNNDNMKLISINTIIELIYASTDNIRLVTFNNCFSANIAKNIVTNIECAIGMNTSIGDNAAIIFASQLYSSIGFGLSIDKSFKQALVALKLAGIPEDNTPELYTHKDFNSEDIYLVKSL